MDIRIFDYSYVKPLHDYPSRVLQEPGDETRARATLLIANLGLEENTSRLQNMDDRPVRAAACG